MKKELEEYEIESLLDHLDGSGSDEEWNAVKVLHTSLGNQFPSYLLQRFRGAKKWGSRSSLIYHATKYAKVSEKAVELGLLAIKDKSKVVRYRGCLLLACAQSKEILSELRQALNVTSNDTKLDILAAIDAIEHQNQNYFVDRDHSGQITLNIQDVASA